MPFFGNQAISVYPKEQKKHLPSWSVWKISYIFLQFDLVLPSVNLKNRFFQTDWLMPDTMVNSLWLLVLHSIEG